MKITKSGKIRLNLEVDPKIRERILELQTKTGAESITEVIRRSLVCYESLVEIKSKGNLILREGDSETKLLFVI